MSDSAERDVQLFTEVMQLPTEQRIVYLERACAGDGVLRQRVEGLLQAHEQAGQFLVQLPERVMTGSDRKTAMVGEKSGDRVGRYKLLEQIGEGGCGVVFMAQQEEPIRRRVALKIIKPGMDTKSVIARFEAERQALALMDHPNIAKVFDAGATQSGRPYFVMELIRGVKITEYCDQHSLPTEARLKLFIQVCHAVRHAHQKGIIHRDIKPSNILVTTTAQGEAMPVVIDFGIAKATTNQPLTDKTLFTAFEMLIGTPAYMSPEQAAMTNVDVDTRTDIYSLGVLLYELLTSSTPFDTDRLMKSGLDEIRRVIREQEPARPSTRLSRMTEADLTTVAQRRQSEPPKLIRSVSGDLDWIVMKAMEKDPGRRYETANGLALDVQRFLADEAVFARPPSKLYRFQKSVRRHKLLFASVVVIALLVILSLIVVSLSLARERLARQTAAAALLQAKADKTKAESEAARSQQVTKFLEDMLQGAGPSAALGRDTTMLKEILDRTAKRVDNELTNQPDVEAELSSLIGQVYYELGNYEQAEQLQRSALAINQKLFGPESRETAAALNDLGLTCWREGKQAEAETNDLRALTISRRLDGDESPAVATSLNNLADVYRHYGRPSEAEPLARQALAIRQKLFGKDSVEAANSLRVLSILMGDEGKWAESEAMGQEILAIRRKRLGPDDPLVAASLADIAWAAGSMGKLDDAESLEGEALVLRQKVLGNEHPAVATSFYLLGDYMRRRGELDQAYSVLSSALSIQRKTLGEGNPAMVYTLRSLGLVLEAQGKLTQAGNTFREALDLWRKQDGANSTQTLVELQNVARVLIAQRKFSDANRILNEVLTPALVNQSSAATALFQRAGLEARQNLWQKAAADASLAFADQPGTSSWYCMVAGLLVKTHNVSAYELLRKHLIADYAETTNVFVADQVAKACLFLPPSESDLKIVGHLADVAVTQGVADEGAIPFFEVCKALAEYRAGNFNEAIGWAQKSTQSKRLDAYGHAYGVLALAYWQLGQKQEARDMLAKGEALVPRIMPQNIAEDPGDTWLAWLYPRITLDEAGASIQPTPDGSTASDTP